MAITVPVCSCAVILSEPGKASVRCFEKIKRLLAFHRSYPLYSEDQQSGDYYLALGTPDDYKREIRRANGEINKLCADPSYLTKLAFVEEPASIAIPVMTSISSNNLRSLTRARWSEGKR